MADEGKIEAMKNRSNNLTTTENTWKNKMAPLRIHELHDNV